MHQFNSLELWIFFFFLLKYDLGINVEIILNEVILNCMNAYSFWTNPFKTVTNFLSCEIGKKSNLVFPSYSCLILDNKKTIKPI